MNPTIALPGEPLALARALHDRGLSVIPIPRPSSDGSANGKVPAIPWKAFQQRRPTDAELSTWFGAEPVNVGIVTGAISGVVVVDADSEDARRWIVRRIPYTPWQTQTARGWHLFYRHPGERIGNKAKIDAGGERRAIDVRADGGFVVAPGSVHASGVLYQAAGDWSTSRDRLPMFDPSWLVSPRARRQVLTGTQASERSRSVVVADRSLLERGRSYLAAIPRPDIGAGSDAAVFRAACRLVRGFALPASDAVDLLWSWAGGRPGWSLEWVRAKVEHAEHYGAESIGALR